MDKAPDNLHRTSSAAVHPPFPLPRMPFLCARPCAFSPMTSRWLAPPCSQRPCLSSPQLHTSVASTYHWSPRAQAPCAPYGPLCLVQKGAQAAGCRSVLPRTGGGEPAASSRAVAVHFARANVPLRVPGQSTGLGRAGRCAGPAALLTPVEVCERVCRTVKPLCRVHGLQQSQHQERPLHTVIWGATGSS